MNQSPKLMLKERDAILRVQPNTPFSALSTRAIEVGQMQRLASKLERAGFKTVLQKQPLLADERQLQAAAGRVIFNQADIERFLLDHVASRYALREGFDTADLENLRVRDNDVIASVTLTTGRRFARLVDFCWKETLVALYEFAVPEDILDEIIAAREANLFDFITIASLKITVVKEYDRTVSKPIAVYDPLVCGRFAGEGNLIRYLIAQYGDDIDLDALLGK